MEDIPGGFQGLVCSGNRKEAGVGRVRWIRYWVVRDEIREIKERGWRGAEDELMWGMVIRIVRVVICTLSKMGNTWRVWCRDVTLYTFTDSLYCYTKNRLHRGLKVRHPDGSEGGTNQAVVMRGYQILDMLWREGSQDLLINQHVGERNRGARKTKFLA